MSHETEGLSLRGRLPTSGGDVARAIPNLPAAKQRQFSAIVRIRATADVERVLSRAGMRVVTERVRSATETRPFGLIVL